MPASLQLLPTAKAAAAAAAAGRLPMTAAGAPDSCRPGDQLQRQLQQRQRQRQQQPAAAADRSSCRP
ncbi:hypothetical protein OEZ85_006918 [Tetradesmus obliquus]|uniref:Uncharacterized protein n=1 Tax=Tetradesmus obliquus TaxID=3088 RepID=A0ABY8U058_TETOB|nr:hypothetical protein OEZ85_006918 [Tetradesmus obliquus]